MTEEKPVEEPVQEQSEEQSGISAAEEKPLEQPHFDPDAEKKPTEKPTEEKPVETKAPEVNTEEKSAEQKKAEANPEYMGNEMGEDILSIPLDDPVANAAASKIQVCHKAFFIGNLHRHFQKLFRGAKGKGFKDRILANRQMNAMQLLKKSAKEGFSSLLLLCFQGFEARESIRPCHMTLT